MRESLELFLLRIYIDETDLVAGKPLYERIVLKAKELGLAGATVLRGIMGFGIHSQIHSSKILRISDDMPVVVEIIDSEKNLEKIMPYLEEVVSEGLITRERLQAIWTKK